MGMFSNNRPREGTEVAVPREGHPTGTTGARQGGMFRCSAPT